MLPVLLWIFTKHRVGGLLSAATLIIMCIALRIYYAFHFDFVANMIYPPYPPKHGANQNDNSYNQSWTRMSVYFIAVALALMMIIIDETAKRKSFKFVLKRWQYWSCMLMVAFLMLSCVVWPYQDIKGGVDGRWSKASNAWYYALSRPAWV